MRATICIALAAVAISGCGGLSDAQKRENAQRVKLCQQLYAPAYVQQCAAKH